MGVMLNIFVTPKEIQSRVDQASQIKKRTTHSMSKILGVTETKVTRGDGFILLLRSPSSCNLWLLILHYFRSHLISSYLMNSHVTGITANFPLIETNSKRLLYENQG
ncbi:11382_t:CDS:1 [Acaulospora morrowiae]|uniref:11382_t:CDS:1 n=1 Tax=Acaulospora morrowiae TaxID=94023 RepID=A0A9N9H9P5_9GLOM|nr:11382_t:CDS:1 [Acaulospora morrowiae]